MGGGGEVGRGRDVRGEMGRGQAMRGGGKRKRKLGSS